MNQGKYKTVLCKHFGQTGTCSYGDKCQFAHGFQELKNTSTGMMNQNQGMNQSSQKMNQQKQPPNPSNFKIVKCKNWETNGSCKYGSVCTFAHGETELRTKSDNNLQMSESALSLDTNFMPNQGNPYMMQDPQAIYNLVLQQQMQEMMMNQRGGGQDGQGQMNQQQLMQMMQMMQNQGGQNMGGYGQNQGGEINLNDQDMQAFLMHQQMNQGQGQGMSNMNMGQNPNFMKSNQQ